ncbi:hypothetical protein [Spiroplasma endosymbiont of Polydrusus formosus]|uniref:hypothetical protein n=1 Tax=Spiroplasma endosymbiont of Polydrusus formosus TaxID=3139326 RepID=UPI0035B53B96
MKCKKLKVKILIIFNILQKEMLNIEIEEILQRDKSNKMIKNLNDKLKEFRN